MTSEGGRALRVRSHAVGAVFYLFVALSACLSVIGIGMVLTAHAPTWAVLFFIGMLTISVPLGGVVSYVFFSSSTEEADTSSRVP
jgi:hypothetical protein